MFVPDDVSRALASALKRHRQARGLTQERVAATARLPRTKTLQRLEYHERPCSMPQLVALANTFQVTPHQLLHVAEHGTTTQCLIADDTLPVLDPIITSKAVAAEMRRRRERDAGSSQAEVAKAAGLWISVYQRLEAHERRCVVPQLVKVANALEISPHELLHRAELRGLAGDLPVDKTGLRKAFGIDP